jgi:hypothetical protein
LPRRYKIRQVIDCGVLGAELLEVPDLIPVHPGQAILPLTLRRFTEFAASRQSKPLAADLAKLSAPKTSAEKNK